jgi:hypothetical protein
MHTEVQVCFMLAFTPSTVNAIGGNRLTGVIGLVRNVLYKGGTVAQVSIQDGIIKVMDLEIQDPKAAAVLAAYPEVRWAEITRRALKIGLGYLKGGAQD